MGGQAGVNRADRPFLLAENKTTAGRKICVGHFCNSKRLGPALALTVNESKPGMALPVSRLSPGFAYRGPTPPPGQASWKPPSSPEGRLALRGRVCHRQRPDAGSRQPTGKTLPFLLCLLSRSPVGEGRCLGRPHRPLQWVEPWPLKNTSTSQSLEPVNMSLFGKRIFADVIKLGTSR